MVQSAGGADNPGCGNGHSMGNVDSSITTPDRTALELAKAVQSAVAPDTVILFGSRARGDHRPDSDVDLLIISESGAAAATGLAKRAAREHFRLNPPRLGVDMVPMDLEKFNYCRRAKNHVAAQALRDGVVMSGQNFDSPNRGDDHYPDSWPDVRERLQAAYRHLGTFEREITHPEGDQEMYGFHAQQAVENALKAWLSAADLDYRRVHDLQEVADKIFDDPDESKTLAATQLTLLMDYTSLQSPDHPGERENWLTRYAVAYRYSYSGTSFQMDELDRNRFRQEIVLAVQTFINRAYELTDTDETDVR